MDRATWRRDDAGMDIDAPHAAIGLVFLLAGAVKGITGMGLPTVAVSLLGLWMAPAQAAALLVVPSLATNVAQCLGPHARRLVRQLWPAWVALVLVTVLLPAPASLEGGLDARRLLGAVLVGYGLWGLWRPTLPTLPTVPPRAGWLGASIGASIGALTGIVTATTAVFVFPFVPWLQALRLEKEVLVQALGLSFTVATLALALRLQTGTTLPLVSAGTAFALAAAFAGLGLGALLRARLSGPLFQRGLFAVFIALGAANLLRG